MPERPDLPEFDHPPVIEVALSTQFASLPLQSRHICELADVWMKEFPIWEERPQITPVLEWFGLPGMPQLLRSQVSMEALPPLRRALFRSSDGTELRQVQPDRFVRNWLKAKNPYPRYESIEQRFLEDLRSLDEFAERHGFGHLKVDQCDVTYVNQIPVGTEEMAAANLGDLLAVWNVGAAESAFGAPESFEVNTSYVIKSDDGSKVGRLHVSCIPGKDQSGREVFRLTLTARGKPLGSGLDGVVAMLRLGRAHIVRGFASVTSTAMHRKWGRTR